MIVRLLGCGLLVAAWLIVSLAGDYQAWLATGILPFHLPGLEPAFARFAANAALTGAYSSAVFILVCIGLSLVITSLAWYALALSTFFVTRMFKRAFGRTGHATKPR